MKLPLLPQDTANHWAYGSVLAGVGGLHGVVAGAVLCIVFALGWEIMQLLLKKGHASVKDAVATLAGGATVLVPLALSIY